MSSVVIAGNTSGSVTLDAPAVAGTTVLTLPTTNGTLVTTGTTTGISGSAISTGTVGVSVGGTGANTLTANNVILGNGTSAVQFVAPGSNGNLLTSNGTTWTSAAAPSSTPTTAQVLTATAGATADAVGTYAFLGGKTSSIAIAANSNYAGSNFVFAGLNLTGNRPWTDTSGAENTAIVSGGYGGGSPSGTWKAMGQRNIASYQTATMFLRIS
jgi:hypothetical protein